YLPPLGWALLTLVLAQIMAALGWGDWFPWSVPALASGMAGPPAELTGPHSYLVVLLMCFVGLAATFIWWRSADQAQ
ncbi:MAG: bacitracin ABC transporter permease, partial [Anaerolineae bacterium]|nr:bacitracin ABC transporter permease [Anaerolineae bacterium]